MRIAGCVLSVGLLIGAGAVAEPADLPPLRLGIAGLSHSHVHGILGRSGTDVRIVGIAEANRELAERYAKRYGLDPALLYASLEEMLAKAKPEAVAAFGPTDEHRAVVGACAPRGIHVMVEKPLAFDAAEGLAMQALAEKHRVQLLTNLETTWYPSVHAARALVREGAIGEIRKVVVHDGHRGPKAIGVEPEFLAWLTDPVRNGGGALTDFGCYGANLMTFLMGGEAPLAVTAVTQQIKPSVYPKVDDEATIVVTYPRAQAILQASWNWPVGLRTWRSTARAATSWPPTGAPFAFVATSRRRRRCFGSSPGPLRSATPLPTWRRSCGARWWWRLRPVGPGQQRHRGACPRRGTRVGADGTDGAARGRARSRALSAERYPFCSKVTSVQQPGPGRRPAGEERRGEVDLRPVGREHGPAEGVDRFRVHEGDRAAAEAGPGHAGAEAGRVAPGEAR